MMKIINTEIGKQKEHILTFKNPLKHKSIRFISKLIRGNKDEDLWEKHKSDSSSLDKEAQNIVNISRKWQITPQAFEIKPRKQRKVRIIYLPDDIEKEDRIGVEFASQDLGVFQYECLGKGCLPTPMKPILLFARLDQDHHFNIEYVNPFSESVEINLELKEDDSENSFFALKYPYRRKFKVAEFDTILIPLIFSPQKFGKFYCDLIISIGKNLKWVYPVQMETECNMGVLWNTGKIRTRSNCEMQKQLSFFLEGVVNIDNHFSNLSLYPETNQNKDKKEKSNEAHFDDRLREKLKEETNFMVPKFERLSKMKKQSLNRKENDLSVNKHKSVLSFIKPQTQISNMDEISEATFETENLSEIPIPEENPDMTLLQPENLSFEISVTDENYEDSVRENWLQARYLQSDSNRPGEVSFLFNFHPKKPFTSTAWFYIILRTGGRWKFKLLLESTEPKFYDTLNIITSLNLKKGVQFKMFNHQKASTFKAYFKEDSDSGFNVSPTQGVLQPLEKNGTMFTVTFLPLEYGKTKKAKLVIESKDQYYLLLVNGKFQKYNPPKKLMSRI